MIRVIILFLISSVLFAESAYSGIYGTLKGKVVDEKGESAIGATVMIVGTFLGAKTNIDGKFTIMNIRPGEWKVKVVFIGYREIITVVNISADQVIKIDCKLEINSGIKDEICVTAKKIVDNTSIGVKHVISKSDIEKLPHSWDERLTSTNAGVSRAGDGFNIRGARSGELDASTAYLDIEPVSEAAEVYDIKCEKIEQKAGPGILTAGELNDFRKWDFWQDITENELKKYKKEWNIAPVGRYVVQLCDASKRPLIDATAHLRKDGETVWSARTDNTGKAELWDNFFADSLDDGDCDILVRYDGVSHVIEDATIFRDGINYYEFPTTSQNPDNVDILFAVDATASMNDEIDFLKEELNDIIGKVKEEQEALNFNIGSVFYRDHGDEYLVRESRFSQDINQTISFIKEQDSDGGGDYEEAVEEALNAAVNNFSWSDKAVARIMFLVLDAPPHNNPEILEKLQKYTKKAAKLGVRIIPIACSGIRKNTEFFARSLALATNGTYVFLTDHSGVGNKHIEPTADEYDVESLNALLIRVIGQFVYMNPVEENDGFGEEKLGNKLLNHGEVWEHKGEDKQSDTIPKMKCYPNPCPGELTVEISQDIEEMYLIDVSGKIIMKIECLQRGKQEINLHRFPSGMYFLKYLKAGLWGINKIILSR